MITATNANDLLNYVIARIKASLDANAWLKAGGTGGIKTVYTRVADIDETDHMTRDALPAYYISATGTQQPDEPSGFGAYDRSVACQIQYMCQSADQATAEATGRTVISRLDRWLQQQKVSGGNLDGLLEDGQVFDADTDMEIEITADKYYYTSAALTFTLSLRIKQAG